jgi:flagellar basal-body rod modification protein FlgD
MADTSSIASASGIATNYMKLLVTQLQNQNPLEPMDNNQMASQLAQLSQLQQIEILNTKFSDVVASSQKSYASSLIGKQVSFTMTDSSGYTITDEYGTNRLFTGSVNGIITEGSDIKLQVGNYAIDLDDVLTVM